MRGRALGVPLTACVAAALGGCVLSVDETVIVREPVDRIVVEIAAGDVRVHAGNGPVKLTGSFGGPGQDPPEYQVAAGVLTVLSDCGLCAGGLTVEAPPETELVITVGAGELAVADMFGSLDGVVTGGPVEIRDHGAGPVVIDTDVGDVKAGFREPPDLVDVRVKTGFIGIEVPGSAAYALDLRANGSTSKQGIVEDPDSPHRISARTSAGSIAIRAR